VLKDYPRAWSIKFSLSSVVGLRLFLYKFKLFYLTLPSTFVQQRLFLDETTDTSPNRGVYAKRRRKTSPGEGSKMPLFGPLGRGVLRFWGRGIQDSRSYFGHFWPKIREMVRFRGWCNTTPGPLSRTISLHPYPPSSPHLLLSLTL